MKQYLLNTGKGDLHLVRDERELENIQPDDRVITLMTTDEFQQDAPVPHKSGLTGSIRHHSMSKVETYSDSLQGVVRVPHRSAGSMSSQSFGFSLQPDRLFFIDDTDFLAERFRQMERDPLGTCSLTYFLLTVLGLFIGDDVVYLERLEKKLMKIEENLLHKMPNSFYATIIDYREELTALRAFYEQLVNMADQIRAAIEHDLIPKEQSAWQIFSGRCERLHSHVEMLAEYLLQIRELYQSQIDIQQNRVMTFLTIVTTVFMPLTLITGWFGMNFPDMYLLRQPWGYPLVLFLSVVIVIAECIYFRDKKML